MHLDQIALWQFPESDFAAWCELVGTPQVASHGEYITMLAAVQADQERQGRNVVRVQMSVAKMIDGLAAHGWENSPKMRAAVVGTKG